MLFKAVCESVMISHCPLLCHQEVDHRWSEYQSRFSSLLQWSRQHTALMANKNFPQNPVELKVSAYIFKKNVIKPFIFSSHAHSFLLLRWCKEGKLSGRQ